MSTWRIRVAVPDDPASRGALTNALAGQASSGVRVLPSKPAASSKASEVVVELPQDDALAAVLSALHEISPQVFVSRADTAAAQSAAEPQRGRFGV
jgi:hypothetical protein